MITKITEFKNKKIKSRKINENVSDEQFEEIVTKLPELEHEIEKVSGVKVSLEAELKQDRLDNNYIRIISQDLSDQLSPLGKQIFSTIKIDTWGGSINKEETKLWINMKISYTHPSGGSNGADFLWANLHYSFIEHKWIYGRKIVK